MTDLDAGTSVRLEEDDERGGTFEGHSAFARHSPHYLEEDTPDRHDRRHDVVVRTAPAQFDRTNADDVDRVQHELMLQLAGAVDDHCLRAVLAAAPAAGTTVDDVGADDLDAWLADAACAVSLDTRSACDVEAVLDVELDAFLEQQRGGCGAPYVDLGWTRCDTAPMARGAAVDEGFHVALSTEHLLGLSSRAALFYISHVLGADEYLSARCELAYAPRLRFHPGAVRVARVRFDHEAHWRRLVGERRARAADRARDRVRHGEGRRGMLDG
ncbi:hypothetical protein INN71_02970 [Nocardioides sp. ChNu-153]|uniref:hypothetical protein n=1 Tax=unclassified Nocardioides TaxID=2615069 RepID=UPI002405B408|nr:MULTISPECIES: hypothetical protein [unclassified Nocardioides]MDF9716071.1 hypothetical protein [Nocardioides sp. ChNu-99]MDN7120347.1 hypothetical protein [Nocardioides sp. ChNu-153]